MLVEAVEVIILFLVLQLDVVALVVVVMAELGQLVQLVLELQILAAVVVEKDQLLKKLVMVDQV